MDLADLASALQREPFTVTHVAADGDGPERLHVALPIDDAPEPVTLQISVIATDDGSGIDLVQLFAGVATLERVDAEVYEIVDAINLVSPGGTLLVLAAEEALILRDIVLVPRGDVAIDLVVQAVWLIAFVIEGALADLADWVS